MPIVSVSLDERLLEAIDELEETMEFSGRSAVIRSALRMFLQEHEDVSSWTGNVMAVVVVTFDDEHADTVTELQHTYKDLITTQVHSHIESEKCIELFLIEGLAEQAQALWDTVQTADDVDTAKVIPVED